jgi:hypothetical protein
MNSDNHFTKRIKHGFFDEEDFIKDCPNYDFIPTILPPSPRIIAIGDIHGDLDLAIKSFKLAKLIDGELNWIANPPNTIVVQVGDQIDSCRTIPGIFECKTTKYSSDVANDMKVIDFFNEMHKKAKEKGGAVYSLLGNHEIMNSQGNFDYVSYENRNNFRYSIGNKIYEGLPGRKEGFAPGNEIAKMLACTRTSVLIIGSNLFVHAGLLPSLVQKLDSLNIDNREKLEYLNGIVRKWLLNKLNKPIDVENMELFLNDMNNSPFWVRLLGQIPVDSDIESTECSQAIKEILQVFKIGSMIVGHTPQISSKNGINGTCITNDGKRRLFRIDGGFSESFKWWNKNNRVQVLEILNDTDFRILND